MKRSLVLILSGALAACAPGRVAEAPAAKGSVGTPRSDVQDFLEMYNAADQRLFTVSAEANWKAVTDVNEEHTGERIGADRALAAFRGSRYVIERAKTLLDSRDGISDIDFRQLDNILLAAAESPGTIPDVVAARIEAEARLAAVMDSFEFCLERRQDKCVKPVTANAIDDELLKSTDLEERRRYWESSKQSGPALKRGLTQLRDLRNRVASELGYSSYFHLQVAAYGMSVAEMMQLMDKTATDLRPLYEQLHLWTRRKLAERYKQSTPKMLPAHWVGNRWAQSFPGLVEGASSDEAFRDKQPEWIVKQAERFYTSMGMPPLPKSFWERSDLYQPDPKSKRRKNAHASAWHIDREKDVRSLMNIIPNAQWFETAHHELGHVYYYMAYSNPKVPPTLREGANRAFHEAVGDLIGAAARQEPYLRAMGLASSHAGDPVQNLLAEALDNAIAFIPFAAGTMTHFEHDLYEKKLSPDQFNQRWWQYVGRYQGVEPPAARGEEYCDACTKTHIIDDAAQYYDYAMATLIRYQLHDHIARKILKQDPHDCNYFGNKEAGRWLWEILSLGSTRDWRQVMKEKTGEDISSRAMVQYFQPLMDFLVRENSGQPAGWQ